jgi:hypothetical protein
LLLLSIKAPGITTILYSFATSIILWNSVSKFLTILEYHNSGKHTISESDDPTLFSRLRVCSTALALLFCKCI